MGSCNSEGPAEVGTVLPLVFGYWREFGARYVSAMCGQQKLDTSRSQTIIGPPPLDELEKLAAAVPPMVCADYLTLTVLEALWHELGAAFQSNVHAQWIGDRSAGGSWHSDGSGERIGRLRCSGRRGSRAQDPLARTMWKRVVDDPSHPGQETLRAVRDNTDMASRPVTRSAPKVCPNDPCSCRSGRKYENCCRA